MFGGLDTKILLIVIIRLASLFFMIDFLTNSNLKLTNFSCKKYFLSPNYKYFLS